MYVESPKTQAMSIPTLELPLFSLPIPFHLAVKEIWRNKARYALICSVVALITTLVLFIAGLAEGLGNGNREYLSKLDADLIVFQENVDILISASRLNRSTVRQVERLDGITAAGAIVFSNVSVELGGEEELLKVSLIGVEPGKPGEPPVIEGRGLVRKRAEEALIDTNVARETGLGVGDTLTVKSSLNADEEFYNLKIAGIVESQKFFIQPGIILPYLTWDEVRPRSGADDGEVIFNIIAVKLENPEVREQTAPLLQQAISGIEVTDIKTAYEATPGYSAQQSTLDTQRIFTLIIGILVIGGFFQIQTLQKIARVGMLKAIGASNLTIIVSAVSQIVTINCIGVTIGALGTLGLGLILPAGIPIIFEGSAVSSAIISLLLIGPVGGLVSLRTLLKTEPLTALGLSS